LELRCKTRTNGNKPEQSGTKENKSEQLGTKERKSKTKNKKIFDNVEHKAGIRHSRSFWDRVGYDHLVILLAVPR
jgi:hypothetical protein